VTELALYTTVALALARGMMLETLRDAFGVEMGSQPVPRGPGAATSLVLDLLCCVPALLVLLRAAIDRTFVVRRSLAHGFMILLGAWTMLSPLWASDKFASVISASHWFGALVLLWSTSQLVRDWRGLRLVAAAAFGLLLVLTAHGVIYRLVELPELREQVARDWPTILRDRGWQEGDYIAGRFKMRVMAGEMIGFSASPNTFGAMIVMLGVVTAGLAIQRLACRDEWGWAAVPLLALAPAAWVLWYTNSRTALATPALAAATFAVAWFARGAIVKHRKRVFAGAVVMFIIVVAAVVAHGVYRGTLFHDSLTFRWKYWVGGWRVFAQHALVGVGFANFGAHYLGVRLPEAAEEINDPHNFIVRIFVELGIVGGALLLAWMTRLWWELTRPALPQHADEPSARFRTSTGPGGSNAESIAPLLQVALAATVITIVAAVDFSQQWQFGFIEVLKRLLSMLLLIIGLAVGTLRSTRDPSIDARPAALLLYAALVALGIFLVHNLVDFSLFETGPMFAFAMLGGAALGVRLVDSRPVKRPHVTATLATGTLTWLAAALGLAAPVALAEHEAKLGDDALRARAPAVAAGHFRRAVGATWVPNGDYAFRAARAMILSGAAGEQVRAMLDRAQGDSPMSAAYPRLRAEFELRQSSPDAQRVIDDFERVLDLDPNDVAARLDFAQALERLGRPADARRQYARALELNDLLDPAEPERLPPARVEQIRARIRSLE
jgi:O-antigen ligase